MTVRPPKSLAPKRETSPVEETLQQETMAEKAGTLGRLGERLRVALDRLAVADQAGSVDPDRRAALVDAAAEALWHVVIQRDLMGLSRNDRFLKEIGAPTEVVRRMGARPSRERR